MKIVHRFFNLFEQQRHPLHYINVLILIFSFSQNVQRLRLISSRFILRLRIKS